MVKIERCTGQLVTPDLIGHLEVLAACLRPYLDDVGGDTRLRLPKEGVLVPRLQPRVAVANGTGPGDDAGVHLVRPKVGR